MALSSSLVVTRVLCPKRRPDLLRRPRLLDFLHEHIDRKLVLVSAAAGYGKTALLTDFAHESDAPVCWYAPGESDRDLRLFVEYILTSVRQRFPAFGQRSEAYLGGVSGGVPDPGALANLLVNDIYHDVPDYFTLVLDDYHRLGEDEGINFLLDVMLQNLPDNCHVIIASRSVPRLTPKGMALMVARREVAGLGTADLRFDASEIQALLAQNYNQHIPLDQAEELARESEGWITAIVLTTHSMWKGLFANILRAKGTGSQVYEFLANEVYNQQTPEVQAFLRGSSVLDDMSANLCNRLLERKDARQMLAFLEERNLFTSSVQRGNELWYRYHRLFQEFLQAKMQEAGEAEELHARAGALLEADQAWGDAIRHYCAAGHHQDAARVIAQAAQREYESNHWQTLASWIDGLPAETLRRHPRLLRYRASVHGAMGQLEPSLALLEIAQQGFERQGDSLGQAEVLIHRARPLQHAGRFQEALDCCRRALALLDVLEPCREATRLAAEAHRIVGICLAQTGDFAEGTEALRRALAQCEELADRYGMANLHSDLGTILRMVGNLGGSEVHFNQALELWQELGALASLANTLNNVGLGYHLKGDYAKALETYERALAIAQDMSLSSVQAVVLAGMGDVYRDMGQCEQAFAAYNEALPIAERAQEAWLTSYLLDALGNTYILTGDFVRANELIRQAYEQARERKSRQAAALYLGSLGVLCHERGDPRQAIEYLTQSLHELVAIGARRDVPRIRLHLAQAYYLSGQWQAALESLQATLDDAFALGYDQFLEPVGRRMLPLLHFGQRRLPTDERLADLVRRVESSHPGLGTALAPSQPAPSASTVLRILGFGETQVYRGQTLIGPQEWGTTKAKELLYYLLSYPHRRKEQIGTAFWPEMSASRLRSAFHVTVYRLRRALGVPDSILFEEDRYYFNQRLDYWYDVQEFERLLTRAEHVQERDADEYESLLTQAVALYRGDFLEDLLVSGEAWHVARTEELRKKYLQSLYTLAGLATRRGEHELALDYFQRITRRDTYQEAAHRGIMETLARLGDRNAALRHYRELVSFLQDELGVSPMHETRELYDRILSEGAASAS